MIMELSTSQKAVAQKYLVNGETEWEEIADRVARHVAKAEEGHLVHHWAKEFRELIYNLKFVPAGSILANSGHGTGGLQNCFVLGVEDDIQSISQLVMDAIMTTKFRGGIGIHIGSKGQPNYVRPKNSPFADGKALGPCAVLDMVSECSRKLTTGNKARRGAFMFSMDWRHPDIWEFIQAKTESVIDAQFTKAVASGQVSQEEFDKAWVETHLSTDGKRERRWYNANISVQVDDEFFDYLEWALDDPYITPSGAPISLEPLDTPEVSKACWVLKLWNLVAKYAHQTADPGLLLVSNAKRHSPIQDFISTTNPCGEIWLPIGSSCNLGSIVVSKFISGKQVDWEALSNAIWTAVRFLDDVLDVSNYATQEQRYNITQRFRQIGLGIMGWADALKLLEIPYASQEHLDFIDDFGSFFATEAYLASQQLAIEKGECGVWPEISHLKVNTEFDFGFARRNSTVLSIAPTGSIAQLAGCSWAFEPDFGLTTYKQVFVDASAQKQEWVAILNPYLEPYELSEKDEKIVKSTGSIQGTQFAKDNPELVGVFAIAREVSPEWHIKVQAQWQKWIDSSISKTINLPKEATIEDIKEAYLLSNKLGLKGVTVYRSGTLESEPVKVGTDELEEDKVNLIESDPDLAIDYPDTEERPTNGCRSGSCDIGTH
jgi:ribonucleoside-diphosphate reductase alpha chain